MSSESNDTESREVEYEHTVSREVAIEHIQTFLDEFGSDEQVTITLGEETIEFEPPEHVEFEFEYEEEGDHREVEFELAWEVQEDDLEIGS